VEKLDLTGPLLKKKNGKRETAEGLNQCEKNDSEHTRIKSRRISYVTEAQHRWEKSSTMVRKDNTSKQDVK
jgi:hypothetical protein